MGKHYPQIVAAIKSTNGRLPRDFLSGTTFAMTDSAEFLLIGNRLQAVRTGFAPGMTQKNFAAKEGFNATQWNNWELGTRRIPVDADEKLASTYGLTLDWIYLGRRDGLSDRASKVV